MKHFLGVNCSVIAIGVVLGFGATGAGAIESGRARTEPDVVRQGAMQLAQFTVLTSAQPASLNATPQAPIESEDPRDDFLEPATAPESSGTTVPPELPNTSQVEPPVLDTPPDLPPDVETPIDQDPSVEPPIETLDAPQAAEEASYPFEAVRTAGGAIIVTGSVPAESTRNFLGIIGNGADVAGLTVAPGAPDAFVNSAVAGVRAMALLSDAELSFVNGRWVLDGTAANADVSASVEAQIAALANSANWTVTINQPTSLQLCQTQLAEFSSANYILFQSGSATIAESSTPALDVVASILAQCSDSAINIEGHTDADGDDRSNLALSVARAEAVIFALTSRGVAAERLYAVGYGETAPIASNDTAEGKRLNRRIVFTLLDESAETN